MTPTSKTRFIINPATVVSMVFSPLFIPVYATIIAFVCTALHYLPLSTRLICLTVVTTFTAILPFFILFILKVTGKISDIDISNRRQRALPLILTFVCYVLATLYIYAMHAPSWLTMYFVSGVATALLFGIITSALHWKISMHGAGTGNIMGFVTALQAIGSADINMMWLITAAILLAGIVGTARVILNKHTLMQVFCGNAFSAAVTFCLIFFLCR